VRIGKVEVVRHREQARAAAREIARGLGDGDALFLPVES
jgi:hypothetical protein